MNNRGRPKKEESRTRVFKLRMSDDELSILRFLSDEMGLSKSDVIRKILHVYYEMYIRKH